jgi:RNA polymerase sigma factor (TIGR02999 family)
MDLPAVSAIFTPPALYLGLIYFREPSVPRATTRRRLKDRRGFRFLVNALGGKPLRRGSKMTSPSRHDVTRLLIAWSDGDQASLEQLVPLVQRELHRLAKGYLRQERPDHTLQPTALVNEAYLKLIDWKKVRWQNRAHFIGVTAHLMRRILVDYARRQQTLKRGGEVMKVTLDPEWPPSTARSADVIALDDALKSLAALDRRKSQIVELRFFGGLSEEETAEVLEMSPRTVRREWSVARVWLARHIRGDAGR